MDKNKVSVEVNGNSYTLVGEKDEAYYIRLGRFVDKRVRDIMSGYKHMSTKDAAIMAALSIGDEMLRMKDESEEMGLKIQKVLESELAEEYDLDQNIISKDTFIPRK